MTARFIDIHVLQTVPYSNLNRDDLGSPKALIYGGTQRTRVSSQCWKRATREHMEVALSGQPGYDQAVRTRRPLDLLVSALTDSGWTASDAQHAARVVFGPYLSDQPAQSDSDTEDSGAADAASGGQSNVLLFLTHSQYSDLAAAVTAERDKVMAAKPVKKEKDEKPPFKPVRKVLNEIIKDSRGLISVFGRMIAQLPTANVDAGVQVAHAFTVHESSPEFDYFTAVDDFTREEGTGAGHLATAEFATGTFYRYATVDLADLTKNTGDPDLARDLATQFLISFATSLPSGKSNSTAANTRPSLVAIEVREDQPQSYAVAFEQPVTQDGHGYALPALTVLTEHALLLADAYGSPPLWRGHLNAATTDTAVSQALTAAFGDKVSGGVGALVSAALGHVDLPTAVTTA